MDGIDALRGELARQIFVQQAGPNLPAETLALALVALTGDTVRWIIGDTLSGAGATSRVHILVKPTRSDIATNLVINTDRRTYHLELRATPATYMASVSWTYPQDQLIALQGRNAAAARRSPAARP